MKICLVFRQDVRRDGPVECYPRSALRALTTSNYEVTTVGEGHDIQFIDQLDEKDFDFLIEIENGRNGNGELPFQQAVENWSIPSAVWLIDSHGHPDLHQLVAKSYKHVFFAVWAKRDLYVNHPSAHWAPCATDLKWFSHRHFTNIPLQFDFGFFGSRGGLPRAAPLKQVCERNSWSYDIRQVTKPRRHKWPMCGEAMAACKNLFNHGQKHDGPNQRVMESMAMRRPLITDGTDDRDGMDRLFVSGYHYIGYESYRYADLEEKCKWVMDHPTEAQDIADRAFEEIRAKHTVASRVNQIMEVLRA